MGVTSDSSMVVVTAITKGYDALKDPRAKTPGCRYVCVTDNPLLKSRIWETVRFPKEACDLEPVRKARYVKTHLFSMFPEYRIRFWIDGTMAITDNLRTLVSETASPGKYLYAMMHYGWDDIFREAKEIRRVRPHRTAGLDEQLKRYRAAGMSEHHGMMAETGIRYEIDSPYVTEFMKLWWHEIERGCTRDQISFPYVMWRLDPRQAGVFWLPKRMYRNSRWFKIEIPDTHRKLKA